MADAGVAATAEVAEAKTEEAVVVPDLSRQPPELVPNTRVQNTLTSLPEPGQGAACISGGAEGLTSARSQDPAPGRTFTPPNLQNNERLTSSPKVTKMI